MKMADSATGSTKESFTRAFSYLQSNKTALGLARDCDVNEFHVECIDLIGNRTDGDIGVAFLAACYSTLKNTGKHQGCALIE